MKLIPLVVLCIAFIGLLTCGTIKNADKHAPQYYETVYADSLQSLVDLGGLVLGITPDAGPVEKRNWENFSLVRLLSYETTLLWLNDSNYIRRAYGFMQLCDRYLDSMRPEHKLIFSDQTPVFMAKGNTIVPLGITLGEMMQDLYRSKLENLDLDRYQALVEAAVSNFVQTYAQFPKSYQAVRFEKCIISEMEEKKYFTIQHSFKLKNKKGKSSEQTYYFKLLNDFTITIIEQENSNRILAKPAQLKTWLHLYARNLYLTDSLNLKLRSPNLNAIKY